MFLSYAIHMYTHTQCMTKCIARGNYYKLSYSNVLYAAPFNTSRLQLSYPLQIITVAIVRKCPHSLQC